MSKSAILPVFFLLFLLTSSAAEAAVFTVNSTLDNESDGCGTGQCTLREAISEANASAGPDTINFAPGLNGTIALSPAFGQLEITTDINIDGPGARVVSVSGEDQSRVFLVAGVGTTATIEGLTITNGNAQLIGSLLGDGGGVLNVGGATLTLVEVNISGNTATSLGGGVATRSLLGTTSTTYITRSLISDNNALAGGGGISNIATAGIVSSAVTTVTNSTVTLNNTVAEAGGVGNLGGTFNLINDTISHNSSTLTGGGVVNIAGAFGLGVTNLRNTIVAFNNAVLVGGILNLSDDVLGIFNSLGNNLIGNNFNAEASSRRASLSAASRSRTPTPISSARFPSARTSSTRGSVRCRTTADRPTRARCSREVWRSTAATTASAPTAARPTRARTLCPRLC